MSSTVGIIITIVSYMAIVLFIGFNAVSKIKTQMIFIWEEES